LSTPAAFYECERNAWCSVSFCRGSLGILWCGIFEEYIEISCRLWWDASVKYESAYFQHFLSNVKVSSNYVCSNDVLVTGAYVAKV
jgi:hypothetical protein